MKCKDCANFKRIGNADEDSLGICSRNDHWEMVSPDNELGCYTAEPDTKDEVEDGCKYVELKEKRSMIHLPENSVCVKVECDVYQDGKIVKVWKELGMSEVQTAFRLAEDNYIEDTDMFQLTESGERYLEGLIENE